jgi:hypothetical protein
VTRISAIKRSALEVNTKNVQYNWRHLTGAETGVAEIPASKILTNMIFSFLWLYEKLSSYKLTNNEK